MPTNGAVLRNGDLVTGIGQAADTNFDGPFLIAGTGTGPCVTTPLSVTITAPSAGKVAVSAVFNLDVDNTFADFYLASAAGDCAAPTGSIATVLVSGAASYAPYSAQRLFTVTPGTHTYFLNVFKFNANPVSLLRANLRAVFVP